MSLYMDVTNKQSIEDGIKTIKKRYNGPPTICVNNAGILSMKPFLELTDEEYNKLMAVNVNVSNGIQSYDTDTITSVNN